jgi:hypothetical protein
MGSQPLSQMGREAASSAPSAVASACDERQILRFLDAAAHAHDALRRAEIDRLRRFAEWLAGFGANLRGSIVGVKTFNRRRRLRRLRFDVGNSSAARNAPACTDTKHGPLPLCR